MLLALLLACARSGEAPPPEAPFAKGLQRTPDSLQLQAGPDLIGVCDASTGVAQPTGFLVGDDEYSTLFRFAADGTPDGATALPMTDGELDLEASALAPDGIWWVASHDRGKGTQPKPHRAHLFRTDAAGATVLADHTDLYAAMLAHDELGPILHRTAGKTSKDVAGFSIEALHADGSRLWVGLRAPVVDGKALLVGVELSSGAPRVTELRRVDLGGRGWRALEPHEGKLWAIGGPADDDGSFQLYQFELSTDAAVAVPIDVGDLRPEGLVSLPDGLLLISDDGKRSVDGVRCRDLPEAQRRARTAWIRRP